MKRLALLVSVAGLALVACDDSDPSACPPSGLNVCDPIEQRCCDPGFHCGLSYSGGSFGDVCIGGAPEAAEGASCQPYATGGADACAEGLVCLQITAVDPEPVCHALCRSSDDCSAGSCSYSLSGISGVRACAPSR